MPTTPGVAPKSLISSADRRPALRIGLEQAVELRLPDGAIAIDRCRHAHAGLSRSARLQQHFEVAGADHADHHPPGGGLPRRVLKIKGFHNSFQR